MTWAGGRRALLCQPILSPVSDRAFAGFADFASSICDRILRSALTSLRRAFLP